MVCALDFDRWRRIELLTKLHVGNPLKLGLANMSLLFDTIFIVQHYCLYGPVEEHVLRKEASIDSSIDAQDDRQPLMSAGQ